MDGIESQSVTAGLFHEVSIEDLTTADPIKQIPALHKLLFEQSNGYEYSHYFDILHKHCLAIGTNVNKDVKSITYAILKGMSLSEEQWSKLASSIVNDLGGSDLEMKIHAIKMFETMPASLVIELFTSGIDLLAFGQMMPKSGQSGDEALYAQLRCVSLQVISTLLLYKEGIQSLKSFLLAGWSLLADRILYDPSRRVLRVALDAMHVLCSEIHRHSQHRLSDASFPISVPFFSNEGIPQNHKSFSGNQDSSISLLSNQFMDPHLHMINPYLSVSNSQYANQYGLNPRNTANYFRRSVSDLDQAPAPSTPNSSVSPTHSSGTHQTSRILPPLRRYGQVVFVKLTPHIYSLLNRFLWLEPSDLPPAILLLSCLLQQLEVTSTSEQSNIQVHFMTSPKHLISEIVDTFFFPLLNSKDEALVFESASNLIHIAQNDPLANPSWVLAACRALIGLISRDSARSSMQKVMPVLLTSLRLLSPGVLLPVIILTLQHIYKLQLPSAQRLPLLYRLFDIPIHLCEAKEGARLDPCQFFTAFLKHPWINSLISTTEENIFREDLIGVYMRSLLEHWAKIQKEAKESSNNTSSSSSNDKSSTSLSARSKGENTPKAYNLKGERQNSPKNRTMSSKSLQAALNDDGSDQKKRKTNPQKTPPINHAESASNTTFSQSTSSGDNHAPKKLHVWREVLFLSAMELSKVLLWKTHVRTFCYIIYTNLFDVVCHALSLNRSTRIQIKDLLGRVYDNSLQLKSDAVLLRLFYVIMKHAPSKFVPKLIENLFKTTVSRFLGWLDSTHSTTKERALGYRVDQVRKTPLSTSDLEVLVLLLHMFVNHPTFKDDDSDSSASATPRSTSSEPNPRLAAALHYIHLIKMYKQDDPVLVQRYTWLPDISYSHNVYSMASICPGSSSNTPRSGTNTPRSSIITSITPRKGSMGQIVKSPLPSDRQKLSGSPQTLPKQLASLPSRPFVPPIEFLAREVADKHPDDEFLISYSKSRLPDLSSFDAARQNTLPTILTAPSDPIAVQAYHVTSTECARVTFFAKITNLTKFRVSKVIAYVDTKGRLAPFNAHSVTQTTFHQLAPGETAICQAAFKLNCMHANELIVRLLLIPNADKPGQTLDLQCVPYKINMHIMVMPWIIDYSEYLREWSRYANGLSFKAILDRGVTPQQLDAAISQTYRRLVSWTYSDTFQLCYAGITWWDERLLFSISGSRENEDSDFVLRFEVKTSTVSLSVIVDNNRLQWLKDLTPVTPNWLSTSADTSPDLTSLPKSSNKTTQSEPTSSLDEKLMLDRWNMAKLAV